MANANFALPFYESACRFPANLALSADGVELTYRELLERVASVVSWMCADGAVPRRVGILGSRSVDICVGLLAAGWVGAAYVPINYAYPEAGKIGMLRRSNVDVLIADAGGSAMLTGALLDAAPQRILARTAKAPQPRPASLTDFHQLPRPPENLRPSEVSAHSAAYILFTSGSTGIPKGVVVPCGAVRHFLHTMEATYPVQPRDRAAGTAEISFDLSVYNMLATWGAGASLHMVPEGEVLAPARFIREREITCWLSVPSVAALMARMKMLKPGAFPSLRQTFFCGEPLLSSVAAAWQSAAPGSTLTNMYGPTEATVMCLAEDYGPQCAVTRDCVAVGRPFPGTRAAIASPDLKWVPDGADGELLLGGAQLALGYLDDPERTGAAFVEIDGERWYRTGDGARRDGRGVFHYLGRIDNQVKVLGYRVELEGIEIHLREVAGSETVAAVAWPIKDGIAEGIVAFVAGARCSAAEIRRAMQTRVPAYMVPSQVRVVAELPLNVNGKIDRKALRASLG